MQHSEIRLVWSGTQWNIETSGPEHSLEAGAEFLIRLPVAVAAPHPAQLTIVSDPVVSSGDGKLLFPAGTWLYLPLNPVRNEDKLWALWVAHRDAEKPILSKSPDRPLVPILLNEDLRFAHAGSRQLAACRCLIGDREHESLNQACIHAKQTWTASKKGATNVFEEVDFIHDKAQVRLGCQRLHILDGDPLPENADIDDGTGDLFKQPKGDG